MNKISLGHYLVYLGTAIAFGVNELWLKIIGAIIIVIGEVLYEVNLFLLDCE